MEELMTKTYRKCPRTHVTDYKRDKELWLEAESVDCI